MTPRRKIVAIAGYLAVAALVIGGLAWVTAAALDVEARQRSAQAEAELSAKTRLALWRLDTRLYTDLARETDDLPGHYRIRLSANQPGPEYPALRFHDLIPAPGAVALPYVRQHFLAVPVHADGAEPGASWFERFGFLPEKLSPASRPAPPTTLEATLASDPHLRERLLAAPRAVEPSAAIAQLSPAQGDPDVGLRNSLQMTQNISVLKQSNTFAPPASSSPIVTFVGSALPIWTTGPEPGLVLARPLQAGERSAFALSVVDWQALSALLREDIRDLLPHALLLPLAPGTPPRPEQALTALPLELAPGALESTITSWTPLRAGLFLAWVAAAVALAAVALGGLSLWELSQRRMRFVSTVTHELRTPLTTIRLYIDMLAGGMVSEGRQREEYLATLAAEADRLDRLVRNVLDFSRLENQTPRIDRKRIRVTDLLNGGREAWENRCRRSAKLPVIENEVGSETMLDTDPALLEQILSNLIDNACKYSQGAADPRIHIRVRPTENGRMAFEVEDHGAGIPSAERRLIFRPFRRGAATTGLPGGVGLGLALAIRWARLLDGHLTLAPPAGPGACFRLELATAK
jgi:signal transduction histidine kinase